jgi:formaldehyde-activating enzyme involved in methanogenesis
MSGESIDFEALLADALGITIEELQAAHDEVFAARLAEMVEAGVMTQEQADLIVARKAVQDYIDTESISDMLQAAYEDAVAQALADGVITQEQADQMLENLPSFDGFGSGGLHHGPGGFGGHHRRGGGPGGFGPGGSFGPTFQAPVFDSSSGA